MLLIAEQGMSNVTISAVAERAGVSRQTVYNHFTDIDSIILAVHERHDVMAQTGTLLRTAATAPEKIELLIRHTIGAYGLASRPSLRAKGPRPRRTSRTESCASAAFRVD